jgi:hypothetical protein
MLDVTDLVTKRNLTDGGEPAFDSVFIDFSEASPFTLTGADEAQVTRNPLEGLAEKLDFPWVGFY